MGSLRKLRGRARGSPRRRLPAGAGRGATGDARGPHLHVEQLGRLVHPDGDGALTQGFAEHFLEGIAHLIHPIREREQRGYRQPRSLRGHRRPLTRHRDPSSRVRAPPRRWVSANAKPPPARSPAPRTPVTPRKPRGQEACEKPRQGHPPPSPAGAASQSLALGAATGCQPQGPQGAGTVPSALCRGPEGLGRVRGHAPSVHRRLWEGSQERRAGGASANFQPLARRQTLHSRDALRCAQWARRSSGRGSGRLTFQSSALQPRIPPKSYCNCGSPTERERRAGCSCH